MKYTRRGFLKQAGSAAALLAIPTIIPSRVLGANAPSKRISIGFIGTGGQGTSVNLTNFLRLDDVQVVAVCDAFLSKTEKALGMIKEKYGNDDCKVYQDFRHILSDPSIDAVVISTPDHWHVPMSLMAMRAGKHVFCEKPTLSINEGRELANAFAKSDRVFQAGIEDRSRIHFHKMVEWARNGAIGELEQVKVTMPRGVSYPKMDPIAPPEDLDWNLWQGPAPFHPFSENRINPGAWRQTSIYSQGSILDIGTHLVDTAQLGVNDPDVCPIEVKGTGFIPEGKLTDVPVNYDLNYRYGNGVEMHVKSIDDGKGIWDPSSCYIEFKGSKGWVKRDGWTSRLEASDPNILRTRYNLAESKHFPLPKREQPNFIRAIKEGIVPTYPAIDLHTMSTTLHMGVMSIRLGRKLRWNPQKETFLNDKEANEMCNRYELRDWEAEA